VLEETTYDDDGSDGWAPATRIYYTIGDDVLSQTTSTYSGGWPTGITKYLLYDGHGSTRQLIDSGQNIGANYNYDAYGTLLQGGAAESSPGMTPQQNTSLLYAGEMFDTNSQQYYNRARWYNTLNGTFNRVDPYAGNLQDPQSLHKYAYVHNNPVNAVDPSGLSGEFSLASKIMTFAVIAMLFNANVATAPRSLGDGTSDETSNIIAVLFLCLALTALAAIFAPVFAKFFQGVKNAFIQGIAKITRKLVTNNRAVKIKQGLPSSLQDKAVAVAGRDKALSGWSGNKPSEFVKVDPEDVLRLSNKIGHQPKSAGAFDHGIPGRFYASHSEKQLAFLEHDVIEVSNTMCDDCIDFFAKLSQNTAKAKIVADSETVRIFLPNGEIF